MTGNALYEAVEPLSVWKQLFAAVRLEVNTSTQSTLFEAMSMVKFVLTRLRAQEEEIQEVHLPIFFTGLLEVFKVDSQFHCSGTHALRATAADANTTGDCDHGPNKIEYTIFP